MGKFIAAAAGLAVASTAFANPNKVLDTSINAIPAPTSSFADRGVNAFFGFESSEGYGLGALNGQNGWTEFTANPGAGQVSAANPAAGNQHVRITEDPAATGFHGVFSPDFGPLGAGTYITSVDVAINDDGGSDYDVIGQAPSQGLLAWRVKFSFLGDILVVDDTGGGLAFIDTGADWNLGLGYENLEVTIDSVAGTIDYSYGGAPIYSGAAGVFGATSVEQVVIQSDGFQDFSATPDPSGDFDNLSIVIPTPGAMALLGVAGLAATRRRR